MTVTTTDLDKLMEFDPDDGGVKNWWIAEPGEHRIRVCPPGPEREEPVPFLKARIHYLGAFGDRDAPKGVCPGDGCPACDFFFDVIGSLKGPENEEIRDAARRLAPNIRIYSNIVERASKEILVWSLPYGGEKSSDYRVLALFQRYAGRGLDLTHPDKGRDIFAMALKKKGHWGDFTIAERATKLGVKEWQDNLHDLHAMSHQSVLERGEIRDYIPEALGDFYQTLLGIRESNGGGNPGPSDLSKLKVSELRQMAKEMGVLATGRKADLVGRLSKVVV